MNTKCTVFKLLILFLHNTLRLVQWLKFIYVSSSFLFWFFFSYWNWYLRHDKEIFLIPCKMGVGIFSVMEHGKGPQLIHKEVFLWLINWKTVVINALQWPTVISILLWWSPTEGVKMKKNQCMLSNIKHTKLNCNKNSSKYM